MRQVCSLGYVFNPALPSPDHAPILPTQIQKGLRKLQEMGGEASRGVGSISLLGLLPDATCRTPPDHQGIIRGSLGTCAKGDSNVLGEKEKFSITSVVRGCADSWPPCPRVSAKTGPLPSSNHQGGNSAGPDHNRTQDLLTSGRC